MGRGILECEDPLTNENFILLDDRLQSLEAKQTDMDRLLRQADAALQKLITSQAQAQTSKILKGRYP